MKSKKRHEITEYETSKREEGVKKRHIGKEKESVWIPGIRNLSSGGGLYSTEMEKKLVGGRTYTHGRI